jgi:hypothetical protein
MGGVYSYDGFLYYQKGFRKMNAELSIELMVALFITASFTTLMWWMTNSRDSTAARVKRGRDDDDKEEGSDYDAGFTDGALRAITIANGKSHPEALKQIKKEANGIENSGLPYTSLDGDDGYYAGLMAIADIIEKRIAHETARGEEIMKPRQHSLTYPVQRRD